MGWVIDVFGTDRKLGAEAGLTRGCPGVTTGEALSSGLSVCKGGGKESADDIGPKREKEESMVFSPTHLLFCFAT